MSACMTRTTVRRCSAERGMTIIESMIAMAILTVGVIGAASGILTASRQNSMAGRIGQASAIASAVRAGLSVQGAAQLLAPSGLLASTYCSSDAAVKARSGGLDVDIEYKYTDKAGATQQKTVSPCVIDLDTWDGDQADEKLKIVPGYENPNKVFSRVVVYFPDGNDPPQQLMMTVVVSWMELGRRQFHRQSATLYNAAGLQIGVVDL